MLRMLKCVLLLVGSFTASTALGDFFYFDMNYGEVSGKCWYESVGQSYSLITPYAITAMQWDEAMPSPDAVARELASEAGHTARVGAFALPGLVLLKLVSPALGDSGIRYKFIRFVVNRSLGGALNRFDEAVARMAEDYQYLRSYDQLQEIGVLSNEHLEGLSEGAGPTYHAAKVLLEKLSEEGAGSACPIL